MTGRTKHPGIKKDRPKGVMARGPGVGKRSIKGHDGVVCKVCGIVLNRGTWSVGPAPEGKVAKVVCPACTRIRERYAAGTVTIPAEFLGRRAEVVNMVRNLEKSESAEHPLERVMDIVDDDGALVVTTTGVHLARLVAHKLAKRFHKKPRIWYADDEELVHVEWAPVVVKESTRKKKSSR